jgi:WD40 repeat protein
MSSVRGVLLSFAVAFFAAYAEPAGATANPDAVKEIQALLNELGYVPGTSTSSIDHGTDTALTLFFKADNPPELAGIKFGPGVWDNNLDKCLDALRNALSRARDNQTKPSVVMETPHQEYSVHIAADSAGKSVVSTDGAMIKSWEPKTGRQRWSQTVPSVVAKDASDGTITVTDDGRYAIIGSIAFRAYEIATGKVIKTFWDRVNRFNTLYPVAAVAARPGTSELIVAEGPALEKLVVFDWKAGRFLAEIGHESSTSLNLALSADGRYAATTSFDAGIRIWDLAQRRLLRSLTVPGALKFQHPVFLKDGRTVAVFGTYALNGKDRSSTLSIFDIEKGLIATREFSYVDYSHYSAALDDNVLYVTGTENKSDRTATLVIDRQGRTVRKLPELDSHDLVVGSPPIGFGTTTGRLTASSFDDKAVWPGSGAAIGYGGFVREADRSSDTLHGLGRDLFKLDPSTGSIQSIGKFESEEHSLSKLTGLDRAADGRLAGGFFDEGSGQVQDAQGKVICKIEVKSKSSDEIVVIDTFDYSRATGLIALWVDSSVALFDDKTCQEQRRIPVEFAGRARAISIMGVQPFPAGFRFSGDGETLYVWRADTAVQTFDPRTGRRLAVYRTDFDNGRASDELTTAFRSATGASLVPLVHHVLPVPNSKRFIAVITANAFTRNGYKGGLVLSFEEGNPRWTAAYRFPQNLDKWAIDPSGSKLVADLGEFGAHIADLATGREIASLGAQPANIQEIAFSPDARHVFILSGDGVLRIFSATTGALLITSTASSNGSWLAVTPEGFFAGSSEGSNLIRIRRGDTTFEID